MRSKKVLYNVSTNLLLQIVTIVYGFVLPKIIIDNFGSNVNGLISSITQFLTYIVLLESGFGPVVKSLLYKPIAKNDKETISKILKSTESFFRKIALIFIVYIVVLCLFYPYLVKKDFNSLFSISLIIIIAISTLAEYFFGMTYKLFLQASQKTYIISFIQIITYIISVISIILLTRINASIHIIKLISGLIFVLRPLLQNYYVKKKYNIILDNSVEKYNIKQKWDGLAQHIAGVIHANTDVTILTIFCPLTEVSVYSVYSLVVKGIKSLVQSFNSGIDASFGDMIANNELENLNNKFSIYEVFYFIITTIVFSCSIVLITPFITVYTFGVNDANYVRYLFGYLLVISEYVAMIRLPYVSLTYCAGHFKETRTGAWIECMVNIFISIILVWKFGIIGVTIGTIVAMTLRTFEFVYHSNKYILKRNIYVSLRKILLVLINTIMIISISKFIPYLNFTSYINWIINAIVISFISLIIVSITNIIFYKQELMYLINKLLSKIKMINRRFS